MIVMNQRDRIIRNHIISLTGKNIKSYMNHVYVLRIQFV